MSAGSYYYLVSIAYDGSVFSGWAKQPGLFTVQGLIEKRISGIFKDKISILGSSRTDKGVHALDQKFTFRLGIKISPLKMNSILKKALSEFIQVKSIKNVSEVFHPINDVCLKEYRYFINTSGRRNIFLKNYCWNYGYEVNVSKLKEYLKIFEGSHDFFNFCYCRKKDKFLFDTRRIIEKIIVSKINDFLVIRVIGKGFLRYQIRAIIGEALFFSQSDLDVNRLREMLYLSVDSKYKHIAPPGGLYLWGIKF